MSNPPSDHDQALSQFTSAGALSSSVRVGIMLALLGVERITFTDLLLAVNVSKSSLNKSIKILADEGYVKERFGFKDHRRPTHVCADHRQRQNRHPHTPANDASPNHKILA